MSKKQHTRKTVNLTLCKNSNTSKKLYNYCQTLDKVWPNSKTLPSWKWTECSAESFSWSSTATKLQHIS